MDNVKKIKQRKFQHLMDRVERPGRVKSGKQEDLEAGLTKEMKEGSRKITKGKVTSQNFQPSLMASVRRKRKKGFQLAKERGHLLHLLNETEPGGKFSTILQKWRQHNKEPFYKSPLNLDLKEYTIQYKQQNLSLPNEFLSSNIFKQIDDMETSEEKDQFLPSSSSSSSREGEVKEGLWRDRTPASQRAPILPLKHNLGKDKLVRGNSEIRSESDKTRPVEVLPSQLPTVQNLLLGKRNQVSEGQSALRTDAKTPTQSSRPRSRPSPRPPQPLPSALPTLASAKEVGLGLSKVLKKVLKKVNLLKKVLKKVNLLKKALKKVSLLKKALKKALKKVYLLKKRTQKRATTQKSELKKVYPLKKVNSRRAPKIE